MPKTLRFGIESLDELIGSGGGDYGLDIAKRDNSHGKGHKEESLTTSVCLIGPDGTGKSVLALHVAAQYMADCRAERVTLRTTLPKVLYISTDLTHSMAETMWNNFDLFHPFKRKDPFAIRGRQRYYPVPLTLAETLPKDMNEVLANKKNNYAVYFVDLAQATAGDDWGFVHRMLSVLDRPEGDGDPRHLVLLDAVEGFETLVGDLNAFGEKSTRRSRIAQVMRLASNKCHLLFVVEEAKQERLPEEFVTDAVIRLRNIEINGYVRRTVEIEKTRGQNHVRGQHPFATRPGGGSTTGSKSYENYDDPRVPKDKDDPEGKTQSYVQVFPSINYLSRKLMKARGESREKPPEGKFAGFGIPYLDTMLGGEGELHNEEGADTRGLPCSSVTALIGDSLTQKSQLGRAFLSRAFFSFAEALARQVKKQCPMPAGKTQQEMDDFKKRVESEFKPLVREEAEKLKRREEVSGVALMMTNYDTHSEELAKEFIQWLNPQSLLGIRGDAQRDVAACFTEVLQGYIESNTICRRMEIHDLSSPVVAHIFQRNIEAAQRKLLDEAAMSDVSKRFERSWRIRMVIDDFNAFRNTFPDIHNDPLLLPFLLFQLGREGISTLIIDTQSGKPDLALAERFESSLREVADYRLYTWRIPFYGETRIAITAIPPLSLENRGLIRELRSHWRHSDEQTGEDSTDRQLTVDPHFELYAGLERGTPHPVPLEVRLYPGTETLIKYIADENVLFKELFVPNGGKADIIVGFDPPNYESFREFCYLQRDTRLDHTLVFQVDEFWLTWLTRQSRTRKAGVLQRQWPFLDTPTVDKNGEPERAADAYYLFQKTFYDVANEKGGATEQAEAGQTGQEREYRRRDFYDNDRLGYGFKDEELARADGPYYEEIDRVPFLWDFTFLLCRENLWKEYLIGELHPDKQRKKSKVREVWEKVPKALTDSQEAQGDVPGYAPVSWRDFLEACTEVAEYHSAKTSTSIPAFDFSMNDGESFSCLILELWASETYKSKQQRDRSGDEADKFAHFLSRKKWAKWQVNEETVLFKGLIDEPLQNILDILTGEKEQQDVGFSLELYKAWLLLTEVVDFTDLVSTPSDFSFEFKSRQSSPQAVAAHHWYQSACDLIDHHQPAENLVAVRLPGHFSVRGDWFLAAAGGSRSSRLAHRAMDLLSSRRANIKRLQLGIGLPVRKIVGDKKDFKHVRTRLISTDEKTGRLKNVAYEDFLKIRGRTKPREKNEEGRENEFYWLWRSSHYGYARYSKVWQKWLNRMALWWHAIHTRHKSTWVPGFDVYDKIDDLLSGKLSRSGKKAARRDLLTYESWTGFHEMVGILLTELQQVSFGRNYPKVTSKD